MKGVCVFEPIEEPAEKKISGIIINDPYKKRDDMVVNHKTGILISHGKTEEHLEDGKRYMYNPFDCETITHEGKTYDILKSIGVIAQLCEE